MTEPGSSITLTLPASLLGTLRAATARQAITVKEAIRRVVCGLSWLTDADLRSLQEPPREYRNEDLRIDLEWSHLDKLTEATRASKMTISSIFRRILYALLITRKISFVSRNENEVCLELTQMHFEFAEDYESEGPIPLLSRQHRDTHDAF